MKHRVAEGNSRTAYTLSHAMKRKWQCLFFFVALTLAQTLSASGQEPEATAPADGNLPQTIEALIEIPETLKGHLDQVIAPIRRDSQRLSALHTLLFGSDHYGIQYRNDYTKTAQEVLQTRSGNCLSLASLYVGAARYLGLKAHFQLVETPEQWERADNFNMVLGHVNVLIQLRRDRAIVELTDTFSAAQSSKFRSKLISDDQLLARYYSNRGAERLSEGQLEEASQLFTKATQIHPNFSEAWVNLGVAKKIAGKLQDAEEAYLKAYKIDRNNYTALNNLHTLYVETEKAKKAAEIRPKIRRHQLKNPYFLEQLSERAMHTGDLKKARKQIAKAIRIHPMEASFHTHLGKIYYQMGKLDESSEAFETAIELTSDPELLTLRKKKFAALGRIMASR